MPFPDFDYCLICDGIRQEIGNKLTINGYYGMAPNVEISIGNPGLPVVICLVAGLPTGPNATYSAETIIDRPNGQTAIQMPNMSIEVSADKRGLIAIGAALPPPQSWGLHSIRIVIDGQPKLDTSFVVKPAIIPPPVGRPQ
jgi:hypothetical protein